MASEFRFIDDEIWLGNRCVARLRHYLPDRTKGARPVLTSVTAAMRAVAQTMDALLGACHVNPD